MKFNKIIGLAFIVLLFGACESNPQEVVSISKTEKINGISTSTFKVWGNCEMCKKTIEGALKVKGITKADWNVESKWMTILYDDKIISLDQIQKNISFVGYDNEKYKGDDIAYNELHKCCQYDRK